MVILKRILNIVVKRIRFVEISLMFDFKSGIII